MAERVGLTQLVGSWRLVSLGVTFADTKERIDLYGPHPAGYMVLSSNGRISFLFTRADRTPPQTDADRAMLFSAMTAYTGLVRFEAEDRFVISVDLAWDPGWTGVQIRYFTLERDRLKIWTPTQMHPQMGSRQFVGDLVWERET
jgi:Lipocalin-like domain